MQKCTLSRIKSYEEKHRLESLNRLNTKNNSLNCLYVEDNNKNNNYSYVDNKKNKNIYLDINNNKQLPRLIKNISSLSNQMKSYSNNVVKKKFKINNLRNEILSKNIQNIATDNNNNKQNNRIINNNLQKTKKNLVSTDNTTGGEIDISENDDINEFNTDEKSNNTNGHIPSLTNILYFPMIFGSQHITKDKNIIKNDKKEMDSKKNVKIIENKKSTVEVTDRCKIIRKIEEDNNNVIVKLIQKNNSSKNSDDKNIHIHKLNFDQPNKNNNIQNNNNKEYNNPKDIREIVKNNIKTKASSFNNLNNLGRIKEKLIINRINNNNNNSNINNNNNNSSFHISNIDSNEDKNKKDINKNNNNNNKFFHKMQKTLLSTPIKYNKLNNNLLRTEEIKKKNIFNNNRNVPNLFIKNSIISINNIKRPLTKYCDKNVNLTNSKDKNNFINSQNLKIRKLNKKQAFKSNIFNNINNSSKENEENKDKNIPNIFFTNNENNGEMNLNFNKNHINSNINYMINNLKKNRTQINQEIHNFSCNKRIIKRVNKKNKQEATESNNSINLIYTKNDCNKKINDYIVDNNNNNVIKKIYSLKGKKPITGTTTIKYRNTYTNSAFVSKNTNNDSQSDTDKEENSKKNNFESKNNKNFDNAKKILNHANKSKKNVPNFMVIPKKVNSCNDTKKFLTNKREKNKIKNSFVYKAFIKYNIENYLDIKSLINLSFINKRFYKKVRPLIFFNYYRKILKEKKSDKNKLSVLKNVLIYSSNELKIKNKVELKEKYEYYLKKIKPKYKEQIIQDISRTFPNDIFFNKNIKKKLYNLLICYSNFNKNIGYAQGLNFVAASCLYYFKNEEEAFVFLDGFINRFELYNVLGIDNQKLIQKIKYFEILLKKYVPDLNSFLLSKLLNHEFFSMGWIITLFSNNMDKKKLLICWCFMIIFGWKFFFSFILQLLIMYKDIIMNYDETKLSSKMRTILNDEQFLKDFNLIIKNSFNFMVNHILL